MSAWIALVANAASLLVLVHGAWWTLLCLVALPRPGNKAAEAVRLTTVVIVPAHDEAEHIATCIQSLREAARPELDEILVVADNCTDDTAARAADAGATVIARAEMTQRGKGYALDFAMAHLAERSIRPDIVAFIDADTTVSGSFFTAIAQAIGDGAEAVQVHYAASPGVTGLGRLRCLAFEFVHWSRPLGVSRLGLCTSLKGNGMAIGWTVAARGLGASGLAEDAAMSLELARQGIGIQFVPEATVTGLMAQSYSNAAVQDERWERGRLGLIPAALRAGLVAAGRRHFRAASSALEVASLPLSLLASMAVGTLLLAAAGIASLPFAVCAAVSLGTYVIVGAAAARISPRALIAMVHAPRFVLHKIGVYLKVGIGRRQSGWQRTDRA